MNSARSLHDAYLNCESPVPDLSLLYHRTPTLSSTSAGSRGAAAAGGRSTGDNQRQTSTSTPTASSTRSSSTISGQHRLGTPNPVARAAHLLRRSNSLSTPPTPIRPTTTYPISGSRSDALQPGRRGTPIPMRRQPTTPTVVGPTPRPLTPADRAALLRATINYLPTLSVATIRTIPPQPPPQSVRPNAAALSASHNPLHRVPPLPPPHARLSRLMTSSRQSAPSPPARARSVAAAMASSLQTAASRNVGSIYARAMIKLKTTVYKWRGAVAEAAEADTNCAICLDEMAEGALVRRLPCLHVFHKPCVDTWLTRNLNCPTCRRKLA